MHVDRSSAEDARHHGSEKSARHKFRRGEILKDRHFREALGNFIDCSLGNRCRNVLAFAHRLRPGLQYPTFGWIDFRVRQCSVVGVFHQDQTGSVVSIILLPKFDEQIEQPVRCLGLLLQDVGAEPENETECCEGMAQLRFLASP